MPLPCFFIGRSPSCIARAALTAAVGLSVGTVTAQDLTVAPPPVAPPTSAASFPPPTPLIEAPWGPPTGTYSPSLYLPQAPMGNPAPAAPPEREMGTRIVLECLAGLGMGVGVGLAGGLVGWGIGATVQRPGTAYLNDELMGIGLGVSLGWTFGIPAGVVLAGRARGGTGGYGWALLGELAGTAVGGLLDAAVLTGNDNVPAGVGVLLGVTTIGLAVGGAVLGFELSSDDVPVGQQRPAGMQVMPALSVTQNAGVVGLAGIF